MDYQAILRNVDEIARGFARERADRQQRRALDPADFAALSQAGFLLSGVPVDQGGIWESPGRSARPICELLRALAHGDASVALVASMHPSVLSFWLPNPVAPEPHREAWARQRRRVFELAAGGHWWGTVVSEPGSGGDVAQTKATARLTPDGQGYRLSGQKHFGSGSGITSFMITSAVPEGEPEPDWFFLDLREMPWDGTRGVKLLAPWDGHGMTATQSHGFLFEEVPATRSAWPGNWRQMQEANRGLIPCLFTAVIVGIVETALDTAREQLGKRRAELRAYDRVEWTRANLDGWLIQQAYDGMLRAMEQHDGDRASALRGKSAVGELAESALGRLCRVLGGGTFSRSSPFGHWMADVRALGFLRPPWGLAYDQLFELSWEQ
jgi:alkylation response protein AidB-like acyl-CoA dehydrogenase